MRRISIRASEVFDEDLRQVRINANRLFLWLFVIQWAFAIALALVISPYAWSGRVRSIHLHVELAVWGGAILNSLPIALILLKPHWPGTRQVIAVTQMLWSAVFVHLTGGRIETHFHIFVSLAILSTYRDPRLLVTATLTVAADHLCLGFFWPESVYGVSNPEWWRFLEHAAWVVFEDVILIINCHRTLHEMHLLADREATLEVAKRDVEQQVGERTAELKTSGDRYRALIENTSAVPWELARDGCRILYAAPQLSLLFGIPAELVAPHNCFLTLLHPDDRDAVSAFIHDAAGGASGRISHIDSRIVGVENRLMYIRSFVAEQLNSSNTQSICGFTLDITQQKQMELELSQAQKLESIGQLAAGIAHEINTPTQFIGDNIRFLDESVGGMLGVIEQLIDAATPVPGRPWRLDMDAQLAQIDFAYLRDEIPKAIAQSLEGVRHISKIVGAMKEFSHPAVDRTPVDLNRAIASTITVATNEWKYVAEVVTEFDALLPPVSVMPGAFNQVILNLLVNSAHAVAEANAGAPSSRGVITVSTQGIDGEVEIRVRDNGAGIPEKIRARIFDPFFTTKPVGKGTGQGLAIAHDVIVKKHGGSISVESRPGTGTTFILRLPMNPDMPEAAVAA